MAALSDAVVIGIVLALVFSAAIYYVFTLFQQLEVKVNLLNNIILDLKKTNEASMMMFEQMDSAGGAVADFPEFHSMIHTPTPVMRAQEVPADVKPVPIVNLEPVQTQIQSTPTVEKKTVVEASDTESVKSASTDGGGNPLLNVNYESMSYKELQAEAKRKHITGIGKMNKTQLIESLKKHDSGADMDIFAFDQTNGEFVAHLDGDHMDALEVSL